MYSRFPFLISLNYPGFLISATSFLVIGRRPPPKKRKRGNKASISHTHGRRELPFAQRWGKAKMTDVAAPHGMLDLRAAVGPFMGNFQ